MKRSLSKSESRSCNWKLIQKFRTSSEISKLETLDERILTFSKSGSVKLFSLHEQIRNFQFLELLDFALSDQVLLTTSGKELQFLSLTTEQKMSLEIPAEIISFEKNLVISVHRDEFRILDRRVKKLTHEFRLKKFSLPSSITRERELVSVASLTSKILLFDLR